ncbi:unnamed protein product [Pleuronectes platessa]|uniref:Uncharacterized protein n=1 Tax=Pleuronectes platessa TaxID=8262 RepID=A0A9N7U079_PLEPL|nr:unnamed protein product [Pleuronectes platessa]
MSTHLMVLDVLRSTHLMVLDVLRSPHLKVLDVLRSTHLMVLDVLRSTHLKVLDVLRPIAVPGPSPITAAPPAVTFDPSSTSLRAKTSQEDVVRSGSCQGVMMPAELLFGRAHNDCPAHDERRKPAGQTQSSLMSSGCSSLVDSWTSGLVDQWSSGPVDSWTTIIHAGALFLEVLQNQWTPCFPQCITGRREPLKVPHRARTTIKHCAHSADRRTGSGDRPEDRVRGQTGGQSQGTDQRTDKRTDWRTGSGDRPEDRVRGQTGGQGQGTDERTDWRTDWRTWSGDRREDRLEDRQRYVCTDQPCARALGSPLSSTPQLHPSAPPLTPSPPELCSRDR